VGFHRRSLRGVVLWLLLAACGTSDSATSTIPPVTTSVAAVPDSAPVFLGGGDCDGSGPFVRWFVENRDIVAHDVFVEVAGEQMAQASIPVGTSASGRFVVDPGPNEPVRFVAGWAETPRRETTLLFRPSLCASGYENPARGPEFVAGASCVDGVATVEWQLVNSSASGQDMNVTATDDENGNETLLWPSDAATVRAAPAATLDGSAPIPERFVAGAEVRVRAWWRTGDPNTHSRVAVFVPDC
jgi:hypothetical protein